MRYIHYSDCDCGGWESMCESCQQQLDELETERKLLLRACKAAALLYDHLAMSPLESAVKYGPDYNPPTDEDLLNTRNFLNEAIARAGGRES